MRLRRCAGVARGQVLEALPVGAATTATRTSCCVGPRRHTRFAHIANRIGCVVGKAVEDALATKVGTADKPERLYSDGPLPQAEHRGVACSACLRRRRSACRSSHSIFGRRRPLRNVRLIAQVLSLYLFCRHVLEEEEARAPSPKDGRAGGDMILPPLRASAKPARARSSSTTRCRRRRQWTWSSAFTARQA